MDTEKPLKIIAMIPARYEATRFPGKLMEDLHGKSVIRRTYEAAASTGLFEKVYVVTDSSRIYDEIIKFGGRVMRSKNEHECGSDRIAEAVENLDADIIVNIQGDEPLIDQESLSKLLMVFQFDKDQVIDLASLKTPIYESKEITSPNTVKVVTGKNNLALYFSRFPIPYPRETHAGTTYYKHIGVYAFRKSALMDFKNLPMLPLEATEKIEALRFLEYGKNIMMVETKFEGIGIDTPEDLEKAREIFKT